MKVYRFVLTVCCVLMLFGAKAFGPLKERVFLQTDKQLYLAGELVWLKLITTDTEGYPLSISKVAYVELLGDVGPVVQVKLEIVDGVAMGWMLLPTTLTSANYRLVAYTRYMLNEGENVFFSKIIPVLNTFTSEAVNLTLDTENPFILTTEDGVTNTEKQLQVDSKVLVKVVASSKAYATRSIGDIRLEEIPDNMHTLSVSIYGDDLPMPTKADNIFEWKGKLLDKQHSATFFSEEYIPEYEGHILSGEVINVETGKKAIGSSVTPLLAFPGREIRVFAGQTNSKGDVTFYTKRVDGAREVAAVVLSALDGKSYRVDIKSPFFQHSSQSLPDLAINTNFNDRVLKRSVGLQALNAYMADSLSSFTNAEALFQLKPSIVYLLDNYTRFKTMSEVFIEFIPEARFRKMNEKRFLSVLAKDESRSFSTLGTSLVLLDGIPIVDHDAVYTYDPLLVEKVDIYTNKYSFGKQIFDGIISFQTYKGDFQKLSIDKSTQIFSYEGTQSHRRFYAPAYLTEEQKASRIPDYRHTLLWSPSIAIAQDTSTAIVPFTTSDLTGSFVVIVEGITKDGQPIFGETQIRVE